MELVAYTPGQLPDLPAAPGWPHADTPTGLAFAATGAWTWLIVDDDGRIAGECGVKGRPGPDGLVEIGYGLAGPSRGRGLGGRAVATLVEQLLARPDVSGVEASVAVDNTASRRVLDRLGFTVTDVSGGEVHYRRLCLEKQPG